MIFPRIPLVPQRSISPESALSKPKTKSILKGKIDYTLESVELNFETDEKMVMDTWQQSSLAISHMVSNAGYYIFFLNQFCFYLKSLNLSRTHSSIQ